MEMSKSEIKKLRLPKDVETVEDRYKIQILKQFLDAGRIEKDVLENYFITLVIFYKYNKQLFIPLQDFIGEYLKKEFSWVTSIGLIEAAENIVKDAKTNGNIKDE